MAALFWNNNMAAMSSYQAGADPGFFLGGGAPLRNDVTDRWGKKKFKANTYLRRRKLHLMGGGGGGGGVHPLHPPTRSAPDMELL